MLKNFKEFDDEKGSAILLKQIKIVPYKYTGHMNPYLPRPEYRKDETLRVFPE